MLSSSRARALSAVEQGHHSGASWPPFLALPLGNPGLESLFTWATHLLSWYFYSLKSFDTVDRNILDCVLRRLGLPGWFRHVYFEFHSHVRLRFKLAAGIVEAWSWDGGIPQGCPLSVVFIVAPYLPWCQYLEDVHGV